MNKPKLQFLYTNIGRGHPFYLDGISNELDRNSEINIVREISDVFTLSGFMSKQVWKLARFVYRTGSSCGSFSKFYNQFRKSTDYNKPSLLIKFAGKDILRKYESNLHPLIVAHPILIGILTGRHNLIYQHGELVAPKESLVKDADYILVPTKAVADNFIAIGYPPSRVIETGLCLEPALVRQAEDCFQLRKDRLKNDNNLTGALFSSGAEPQEHIKLLLKVARSLIASGQKVILFASKGGSLALEAAELTATQNCTSTLIKTISDLPIDLPTLSVVISSGREQENSLVAKLFSEFDFVVAPPHERTNWGIGLGLPIFLLTPCYGSYAPLNLELLLSSETGMAIENENQALAFGDNIDKLKEQQILVQMSEAGWGKYPINGFSQIALWLERTYF